MVRGFVIESNTCFGIMWQPPFKLQCHFSTSVDLGAASHLYLSMVVETVADTPKSSSALKRIHHNHNGPNWTGDSDICASNIIPLSHAMPGALALTARQCTLLTACCVPMVLFLISNMMD